MNFEPTTEDLAAAHAAHLQMEAALITDLYASYDEAEQERNLAMKQPSVPAYWYTTDSKELPF